MRSMPRFFITLVVAVAMAGVTGNAALAEQDPADPVGAVGAVADQFAACARIQVCPTGVFANGEAWAGGGKLWQTDFFASAIRLLNLNTCQYEASCPVAAGSPSENAFDGTPWRIRLRRDQH